MESSTSDTSNSSDDDEILSINELTIQPEPIIIRGNGNITLFGLSSNYHTDFPSKLKSYVAPEEYADTLRKINKMLNRMLAHNFRWLIFGCVCCSCTAGCSFWPVLFSNKRVLNSINKLLDWENARLYSKLGFTWKIEKQKFGQVKEYVFVVEELPKNVVYKPD